VAIPCSDHPTEIRPCHGDFVLGDVQYPTLWLPVGLTAAVVLGAVVWPGDRSTRRIVALCLIVLVIVGYFLLPSVFDVDQLIRGSNEVGGQNRPTDRHGTITITFTVRGGW